jgi:hypothetical protein
VINRAALDQREEATSLQVLSASQVQEGEHGPTSEAHPLALRREASRAVEPTVDVVWGASVVGQHPYVAGERTPREALALRLFVWLSERDDRLGLDGRAAA